MLELGPRREPVVGCRGGVSVWYFPVVRERRSRDNWKPGMGDLAIDPVFRLLNITMERPSCVLPTSAIIVP